MSVEEVLKKFWSSFTLPAYDENTVKKDADMPYITYNVSIGDFNTELSMSGNLWYRGTSWSEITAKQKEIYNAIGLGGVVFPCEGGGIWIKRGTPFSQRLSEPSDNNIRRILINIVVEFITN